MSKHVSVSWQEKEPRECIDAVFPLILKYVFNNDSRTCEAVLHFNDKIRLFPSYRVPNFRNFIKIYYFEENHENIPRRKKILA